MPATIQLQRLGESIIDVRVGLDIAVDRRLARAVVERADAPEAEAHAQAVDRIQVGAREQLQIGIVAELVAQGEVAYGPA